MNAPPRGSAMPNVGEQRTVPPRVAQDARSRRSPSRQDAPCEGNLCVGGSDLGAAFMDLGLMDELQTIMTPILLGGATRTFRSGSVLMTCQPKR